MQATTSALAAKNICKRLSPRGARGGLIYSLEPKKLENNTSEVKMDINDKAETITTFNRPPPFSPFIGPLVAISLLETLSSRDTDDD